MSALENQTKLVVGLNSTHSTFYHKNSEIFKSCLRCKYSSQDV